MTPDSGTAPLVTPLAKQIMSGTTPYRSAAKAWPRRPKAVITSSKMSRMPLFARYFAQAVEVAFRRGDATRGSGYRLDDDGGDGFGAVQRDEAQQLVSQLGAPFRLAD